MPLEFVAWHAKQSNHSLTRGVWHARPWACHASSTFQRSLAKHKARVWHTRPWAWHASTSFQRQREVRKARGVPLEFEGVARQHKKSTMACHLSSKVWHAKVERGTSVPLEGLGVARQAGNEEHVTRQRHASHTPAEKSCLLSVFFSLQNVIFLFHFCNSFILLGVV